MITLKDNNINQWYIKRHSLYILTTSIFFNYLFPELSNLSSQIFWMAFWRKSQAIDAKKKDFTASGQHSLPRFSHVILIKLDRFEAKLEMFSLLQNATFSSTGQRSTKIRFTRWKKNRSVFALWKQEVVWNDSKIISNHPVLKFS